MRFKVKTPSKIFNGVRAGIHFNKGEAQFDDKNLVSVFKGLGYEVTEAEVAKVKDVAKPEITESKPTKSTKKRGE